MYIYTKTLSLILAGSLIPLGSLLAENNHHSHHDHDEDETEICMGSAPAILEVADFDGNGIVNEDDITIIKSAKKRDTYYAFYDINADGEFNRHDVHQAYADLGKSSSTLDQQKAALFHQIKVLQQTNNKPELQATQYMLIAQSLAGHGEHWFYNLPQHNGNPYRPGGVNYSAEDNTVKGVYWSVDAIPVFSEGATDFPQPGGDWMTQKVISFSGHPLRLTNSPDETWHTHAGLCVTAEPGDKGPLPVLNQHTTFAECQALPTLFKTGGDYNVWMNIWMLHAWMFDLNPNGFFANTHPCVDPSSPTEESINGGREVPAFFQDHHNG